MIYLKSQNQPGRSHFLVCESRAVFALLTFSAGMMGAYTFNMRGGVFCNAQTANFVMMAVAFGKGNLLHALYYFIPVTAYFSGAFISEIVPTPIKRLGLLRWDTCLIAVEGLAFLIIGFIPLTVPDQVVQVTVNFLASMQYNTFRQAEGIPGATTFCTNHLRQVGISCAQAIRKKDYAVLHKGAFHCLMLLLFVLGAALLTFGCRYLQEKAIWMALVPNVIIFCRLAYADLTIEHDLLKEKPAGH